MNKLNGKIKIIIDSFYEYGSVLVKIDNLEKHNVTENIIKIYIIK